MKHYLTYQDGKSNKFWQIEVTGKSLIVKYGKTGSAGQVQNKSFDNDEECLKAAKKLINEKQKKGYREASSQPKKLSTPKIDFSIGESFSAILKSCVEKIKDKTLGQNILKISWQYEAGEMHEAINTYWSKISKSTKKSIGIFDIRWDDSATNHAIEFDYEEGNDPDNPMEDGAIRNEKVLDFLILFEEKLKLNMKDLPGQDFDVVKEFICFLSVEAIIQSIQSPEFSKIKKKSPYYIMFSKFHDDESEIIFDSEASESLSSSFDARLFKNACSKGDIATLLQFIPRLMEVTDKKHRDKLVLDFYECFTNINDGAFSLLQEYSKVASVIGYPNTKVRSPFGDTREMTLREAFVTHAFASKQDNMIELAATILPDKIGHPTVLFNILKHFALKKEKEKVLHYTKQSLFMGQKSLIKKDPAFNNFFTDPDFREMLENSAKYM